MASETRTSVGSRPWTLLLGPGQNLEELIPFIQALIIVPPMAEVPPLRQLENLDGLLSDFPEFGRLVLDTGCLLREDVGLVRGFLRRRPSWELVLFGDDPTGAASRTLLSLGRVRFLPSPLNVAGLREICANLGPDRPLAMPSPRPDAAPEPPHAGPQPGPFPAADRAVTEPANAERGAHPPESEQDVPESEQDVPEPGADLPDSGPGGEGLAPELLDRVDRILRGEGLLADPVPPGSPTAWVGSVPASAPLSAPTAVSERTARSEPFELDQPFHAAELEELAGRLAIAVPRSTPLPSPEPAPPAAPAPYFKNQVADLADIVQCVDLTLGMAREEATNDNGSTPAAVARRLDELSSEVARLRQFTRTLSFLAAPPIAGNQRFELAPMLEEMLIARRGEPDAPRYLLRTQDPLLVRSDKRLLAQVLDAILFLSHHAAGPEGTVRVDGRLRGDQVTISIRFPSGPLSGLEATTILQPYALRRTLPELGANSLAAATGIMRGQGGALELRAEEGDGFEWLATLPGSP